MFLGCGIAPFQKKVFLSSPLMHDKEQKYIKEAFDTNWMSTVGHNIDESERLVAERIGRKYAIALSTGTAALHLAVKTAGVTAGTKVFCSDLTFIATVNPIVYEGGIPIFVDSESTTWNMDPKSLEKAFQQHPDVKFVMIVNLFGTPCRFDEIREICNRHGAVIIEDAAESFGAGYRGKCTGNLGDVSVISFNGNKIITGTSGGMLLTDDEELAQKARKWSTQSRDNAPWYQHTELGYNYRMSNIIAGIIRGQMEYLDEHIAAKKAIYERYKEGLKDVPVQLNPYDEENSTPNFWLSCLTVNPEAMCEQQRSEEKVSYKQESGKSCPTEILNALLSINAEGRPLWKPMHLQPIFSGHDYYSACGDTASDLFNRGLCLPSDINMSIQQQNAIIEAIKCCFN